MGKFSSRAAGPAILVLVAILLAVGCSEDDVAGNDSTREFVEGTLSEPETPETTGGAAFGDTTPGDTTPGGAVTGGATTARPEALLRLEGDPEVAFSGICTVGSRDSVISGRVPERYRFEPDGQNLSCRIQKRDSGGGSLRVVLLAGEDTRSVQQTASRGSVIRLSYAGS